MRKICFLFLSLFFSTFIVGQDIKDYGQVHGNFQIEVQTYKEDSTINAPKVDENILVNSYANIIYTKGKFSAGVRYEAYLNTMLGYDKRYDGQGIAYKYASYNSEILEITAGNFYEQFGNGLTLRAYEDKTLGYDNALDGFRVKFKAVPGINLTGIIGKQKLYFDQGPGIIRGIDGEISVNDLFKKLSDKKTRFLFGGSFVSKYQENLDPIYNLPENVGVTAFRMNFSRGGFNINSEYAYKINDPSYDNGFIFKDGNALFVNAGYSKKGFGILFSGIRLDNMSFRSDRSATINDLNINYLPAISKTHTYAFAAMYPFASQPNGQIGFNSEIFFKIPKKSLIGGKYGINVSINYSQINSIDKTDIIIDTELKGYTSEYFSIGDELYFRDYNIEIHKKISRKYKFSVIYMHEDYNINVIQGKSTEETIHAEIGILDMTYKLTSKHALRLETQLLLSEQYYGDWFMGMLEYTFSPHWFFAVQNQFNYGNPDENHRENYFNITAGYLNKGNRIQIGYGKQREGVTCVGGVCRNIPASNGFTLSVSSTF